MVSWRGGYNDSRYFPRLPKFKAARQSDMHKRMYEGNPSGLPGKETQARSEELGLRYNAGKPKLSLVLEARHALGGVTAVLEYGLVKYHRANWRKGLTHTELADSLLRHLTAYLSGETEDPETGLPHVDHVLCNALFLSELHRTHPELDDRPIKVKANDRGETEAGAPSQPEGIQSDGHSS